MEAVAHEDAIPRLAEHLQPVFDASPDGVYIWLDETHWTCNEKLAELFEENAAPPPRGAPRRRAVA